MSMKLQDQLSNPADELIVDIIIDGGCVLTLDERKTTYQPGFVAIRGDTIAGLGIRNNSSPELKARMVIDASNCLVLPGFVNTHAHAAMTILRGFADDMSLNEWLFEHIFPAEARCVNEHSVYWGTKLAVAEMIRNGITTFADGYFFSGSVARAVEDCGIRAVVGQGILDFPTPDSPEPSKNFDTACKFLDQCAYFSSRVCPSIFCHSPYTCGKETLIKMKELCNSRGALFQIHLSETTNEVAEFEKNHGVRPSFYLHDLGLLDKDTLVAHAVWVNDEEIELLKDASVGISHVVSSNMKLASGVAPLPQFFDLGLNVGLGTDGCASNNRLDLLRDVDLAAKLHKVWQGNAEVVPALSLVEMITIRGAAALGLDRYIGSIEVGKLADIVIIPLNKPHLTPIYNPYSHLVYSARGSDVRDVIVGGEIIMREREIVAFDESRILGEVVKISEKLKIQ